MTGLDEYGRCIKCKSGSGDDWQQCNGSCPVPLSPHYIPADDERNFMKIRVASGKYTFVHTRGDMPIEILRHGEQWISLYDGTDALTAMMAEIDAARVVLAAVRDAVDILKRPKDDSDRSDVAVAARGLSAALRKHDRLVDDHEPSSEWTK